MKTSLFLGTVVGAMLMAGAASAEVVKYKADISGDQENCPSADVPTCSEATGLATLVFDTTSKKLCGKVEYVATGGTGDFTPLTHAVSLAHIHKATEADGFGSPIDSLTVSASPIVVSETLADANATALVDGLLYVNIHTAAPYGDGEMRGFIVPADVADGLDDVSACLTAGGGTDGGADGGNTTTPPGTTPGTTPGATTPPGSTSDGGTTPASSSSSDDGCSTTGSAPTSGIAIALGVGVALAAAKRRKKKQQ